MTIPWDGIDKIEVLLGLVTGFFTLMIWMYLLRKERKDNDLISISLTVPELDFKATLPAKVRRKNLTRAELQGMLGMLPMKETGKRYQLDVLNNADFFKVLEKAQVTRKIKDIEVVCNASDLAQFDDERLKLVCVVK